MFVIIRKKSMTAKKLALAIVELAESKKAEDIVVLYMKRVANFCDYFVICTGNSGRQVKAISDGIEKGLAEIGVPVQLRQKDKNANWMLLDLGDVVAHVFERETREFYRLEYLWQDAKIIERRNSA